MKNYFGPTELNVLPIHDINIQLYRYRYIVTLSEEG